MSARIFYQEDCNLAELEGKTDRYYRLWQSGTCTCPEPERIRMRCNRRSL